MEQHPNRGQRRPQNDELGGHRPRYPLLGAQELGQQTLQAIAESLLENAKQDSPDQKRGHLRLPRDEQVHGRE